MSPWPLTPSHLRLPRLCLGTYFQISRLPSSRAMVAYIFGPYWQPGICVCVCVCLFMMQRSLCVSVFPLQLWGVVNNSATHCGKTMTHTHTPVLFLSIHPCRFRIYLSPVRLFSCPHFPSFPSVLCCTQFISFLSVLCFSSSFIPVAKSPFKLVFFWPVEMCA